MCLKNVVASESRNVLRTQDAYQLPNTGAGAPLQTGTGELIRFRTAFVFRAASTEPISGPPVAAVGATVHHARCGIIHGPGQQACPPTFLQPHVSLRPS